MVDVQRAFKNRVIQFNRYNLVGASAYDDVPPNDSSIPSSSQSDRRLNSSTEKKSVEAVASLMSVNKLNHSLYTRIQYNASSLGKRFTHKSAPRISNVDKLGLRNSIVTHHPIYTEMPSKNLDDS